MGFGVNRESEAELSAISGYDSYSVWPSLPEGLSFQSYWPRVFGKAAAASDATYIYQATGRGKQRQMGLLRLYVAADDRPITGFSLQSTLGLRTTTFSEVNHKLPLAVGGNGVKYSLVPRLPAGLSFNAETRLITGSMSESFPSQLFNYIAVDVNGNRWRDFFLLEVKNRPLTLQSRTHNVVSEPLNISTPFNISLDRASGLGFVNYNLCAGDEAVCPALPGNWSFEPAERVLRGLAQKGLFRLFYSAWDSNGGSESTYVDINVLGSAHTGLSEITVDGKLVPGYRESQLSYSVLGGVGSEESSATIGYVKGHPGQTVRIVDDDGADLADADPELEGHQVALEVGDNTVKLVVTAEDATTTATYTLTVDLASNDTTLSEITTEGTIVPGFSSDQLSYSLVIGTEEPSVTVGYVKGHAGQTVRIVDDDGADLADADPSSLGHHVALEVGDNTVKLVVTAQNTRDTRTYTLTVTWHSTSASLSEIKVDGVVVPIGTLQYCHSRGLCLYDANVGTSSRVTVEFVRGHADQTVTVHEGNQTTSEGYSPMPTPMWRATRWMSTWARAGSS